MIFILIPIYLIPSINIDSNSYNKMYQQINFNTHHFEFYKLVFYLISVSLGFIVINQLKTGVLIFNRFFFGFGSALKDFLITLLYSLIIYFFSGNTVLPGYHNYEGFCDERGLSVLNDHKKDGDIGNFIFVIMTDFRRLYTFKFLENIFNFYSYVDSNLNNMCIFPGFFETYIINFSLFLIPFTIGLNFYAIVENFQTIKYLRINWNIRKNWERKHWVIYTCLIIFFVLNIVFHFVNFARDSLWKFVFFLILFSFIVGYITFRYVLAKKTKFLHITNPTLIMLVLLFVNINCVYDIILFAFLTGLMTSESVIHGVGHIFKDRDLENYSNCEFVPNQMEMEKREIENLDK